VLLAIKELLYKVKSHSVGHNRFVVPMYL